MLGGRVWLVATVLESPGLDCQEVSDECVEAPAC